MSLAISATLSSLCAGCIFFLFHDQFWWPVDEGVYAYVAQRANAGDVIHRDIIDLHTGYGNILNALSFRVFGEDLLSLRYPLVLLAAFQCVVTFVLLRRRGAWVAFAGTFTVAAFSFVQFPNPSANWHALGAFFCLCLVMEELKPGSTPRLIAAGFLVGVCFFTRQLSGALLGVGLAAVLLSEVNVSTDEKDSRIPAFLVCGTLAIFLLAYIGVKKDLFGLAWAGLWSLGLLLTLSLRTRMSWSYAGRTFGFVLLGFALAATPIVVWVTMQGAFTFWLTDIFVSSIQITEHDFISTASFADILRMSVQNIFTGAGVIPALSGFAWIFLLLSVPIVGALANTKLARSTETAPTVILAVFWAISALHFQIPVYLFFALPATLLALWVLRPNVLTSMTLLAVSGWALIFQASQPVQRGMEGIVAGERWPANVQADLPRVSLRISARDAVLFQSVLEAIDEVAGPDERLMTIPMEPEFNFITNRESPVGYYGTSFGLRSDQDIDDSIAALDTAAPLFVVHRRVDKYLNARGADLLERIQMRSAAPEQFGPFDLYRYLGPQQSPRGSSEQ